MLDQAPSLLSTFAYHQRSKHQPNGYARSLGYLDWSTQPDPFRRFIGAPRLPLERPSVTEEPSYDGLFASTLAVPPPELDYQALSQLFYDSLALSAWKQASGTNRWSLRVNPSSGDLHPTEGYLLAGPIEGLSPEPGIYHYSPFEHALERRSILPLVQWQKLARQLPEGAILLGLTSIQWRESWKYGERAFRYCHHDVGHAIGAMTLAAAALGREVRLIETLSDADLSLLFGVLDQRGPEAEHPDCLLAAFPALKGSMPATIALRLSPELLAQLANGQWLGRENRLSGDHHHWPVIDEVTAATRYDGGSGSPEWSPPATADDALSAAALPSPRLPARKLIRQRRSAVAMDGRTHIGRDVFYRMLVRLMPSLSPRIFRVLPWRPRISLALFVHRVEDLERGLYLLVRDGSHFGSLREAIRGEFAWEKPSACPDGLELYRLLLGDARGAARVISCHQDIAADGAFALGMLAEFESSLVQRGSWFYPRLFWETGLIGQLLYLEAEAAGIRATGIGCFFDDLMHQLLGISDRSWQSLYHFTVGGPLEDSRIQTLDAYFHLSPRRARANDGAT